MSRAIKCGILKHFPLMISILLNFQVSILKIYFISTQSLWEKTQEDIFRLKRSLWMAPYLRLSVNQIVFGKCAKNDCQKGIQ